MENITFGINQNLHFSTYGRGTITIKNPEFNYNGTLLTIDGEVGFEDFDRIIHNDVFNFDTDFTQALEGGNILIVSKPVNIKCGLHPHVCADIFGQETNFETVRDLVLKLISSEEEFLLADNWCAFTLSQKKGKKQIGHESIWNTIDYTNPELLEKWDEIAGKAALPFVVRNEELFNKIKEEQGEIDKTTNVDFKELQQFQNFMSDENNPLSDMLSKMTENEGDMESLLGDMSNLLSMFGEEGEEGEEEDYEEQELYEIIAEFLELEELEYSYDEENERFDVKFNISDKKYEGEILWHQDYYLLTKVKYPQATNINRDNFLYRFMNVVNSDEFVGKIYFNEANNHIFVQSNIILTLEADEMNRIADTIDANLELCGKIFPILQSLINGTIDIEAAIEQYQHFEIDEGDYSIDDDDSFEF